MFFHSGRKTYIFVPERLESATYYTVTVRCGEKGARSENGAALEDDCIFSLNTEWAGERSAYC
jgi:hypothetical protein